LFSALRVAMVLDIYADNSGASIKFAILRLDKEIRVCLKKNKDAQAKKLAPKNHKKHASHMDSGSGVILFLDGQSKGMFSIELRITSNKN
jgi:hypothetical protein